MIIEAIGLGLLISIFLTETIGLAAGGIVVPGYIALMLHHPFRVMGTVAVSLATYWVVKALSTVMLIYGRRLLVICILIGYLLGYLSKQFPLITISSFRFDVATIGFIIPGLMAYWMERQGVIPTISAMLVASVLTRLVLISITKGVVLP